ncbi:MAG: Sec1-like protein [Monoraphidium minutum]|nr:MAG: Sec1-like protein [Monoraphidium minutum]
MARPNQKPQLPSLETGPVPLRGFRDAARNQLVDLIDSKRGKKALVLDPAVSGPLTLLDAGLSGLLSEHGVAKLLYLERKRLDDASYGQAEPRLLALRPVIYIARATLDNAQLIAWQIKSTPRAAQDHEFSVFWVPRRSVACEKLLEDEGVAGELAQGELPMDLVPLDDDVLSLELDRAFAGCTLDGDASSLFYAAAAVMRLQHEFGIIPRIQGKGPAAAAVRDICIKMRKERPPPALGGGGGGAGRIGRAILIDREVDLITPMMTQITFEGLIDEVTGIKHGSAPLAAAAAAGARARRGRGAGVARGRCVLRAAHRHTLNARTIHTCTHEYTHTHTHTHAHTRTHRLTRYAREARREYGELGQKDLGGLKAFVKGLPKLLLLDRLSDLLVPVAEVVKQPSFHRRLRAEMDLLEGVAVDEAVGLMTEMMCSGSDMLSTLRLLVLLSATQGGVPKRHWDALRAEFVSAYGHQHLLTLHSLERAGLLRQQQGGGGLPSGLTGRSGGFSALRRALRLVVPDDEQMDNPTDVSHLYKGYAPISIRLVEAAVGAGWAPLAEALAALPGPTFDAAQAVEASGQITDRPFKAGGGGGGGGAAGDAGGGDGGDAAAGGGAGDGGGGGGGGRETVLVVFLGGATFSELSALRFLEARPSSNVRFLALAPKVVNGRSLLEGFVDPLAARYPGGAGGAAAAI